jgi:hypothetical protein
MDRDSKLIFESYKKHLLNEWGTALLPAAPTTGSTGLGGGLIGTLGGPLGLLVIGVGIISSAVMQRALQDREKMVKSQQESRQSREIMDQGYKVLSNLYSLADTDNITIPQIIEAYASSIKSIVQIFPPASSIFKNSADYFKVDETTGIPDLKSIQQGFDIIISSTRELFDQTEASIPELKRQNPDLDVEMVKSTIGNLRNSLQINEASIKQVIATSQADLDAYLQSLSTSGGGGGSLPPRKPGYGSYDQPWDPNDPRQREELLAKQLENDLKRLTLEQMKRSSNPLYKFCKGIKEAFVSANSALPKVLAYALIFVGVFGPWSWSIISNYGKGVVPQAIEYGEKKAKEHGIIDGEQEGESDSPVSGI